MSLDSASHASPRADLEKGHTHGGRFQLDTKDDIEISDPKSGRGERTASHLSTKAQLHCQESHRSVASTTEDLPGITKIAKAGARSRVSDPEKNEEDEAASENTQTLYVCDYFKLNFHRKWADTMNKVEFSENDPRDPFSWSVGKKWSATLVACSYTSFVCG